MSDLDYYHVWPTLVVMELIYKCPFVDQWMIKHLTQNQLHEKLSAVTNVPHASSDMSGFENGLVHWMRNPERTMILGALRRCVSHEVVEYVSAMMDNERKISSRHASYHIAVRCSGDFWTSCGNGLTNICIILTGHWVKMGRPPLDTWWARAQHLKFLTEGDDALVPLSILNRDVTLGLNVAFSAYNDSRQNGGSDFLKTTMYPVFHEGNYAGKLCNTLRLCRSLMWVRGHGLKHSKVMFLWRAKALSLLYLAPHHPIINPLCQAIGRITSGATEFRGWQVLSKKWGIDFGDVPPPSKKFPSWTVSPEMRGILATSLCPELPPICVDSQLSFESQCLTWDGKSPLEIPREWREYPEWDSSMCPTPTTPQPAIGPIPHPVTAQLWALCCSDSVPRPYKGKLNPHVHRTYIPLVRKSRSA